MRAFGPAATRGGQILVPTISSMRDRADFGKRSTDLPRRSIVSYISGIADRKFWRDAMSMFIRSDQKSPLQQVLDREQPPRQAVLADERLIEQAPEARLPLFDNNMKPRKFQVDFAGGWAKP